VKLDVLLLLLRLLSTDAAYSYKQSIVVSVWICWFVGNEHKSRKMAERIMTLFVGADLHGL